MSLHLPLFLKSGKIFENSISKNYLFSLHLLQFIICHHSYLHKSEVDRDFLRFIVNPIQLKKLLALIKTIDNTKVFYNFVFSLFTQFLDFLI